jgi:hypothetical protein
MDPTALREWEATVSFSVNIKALAGLPAALDRRSGDLEAAQRYLMTYTKISTFGLADITGVHQRVIAAISKYLVDLDMVYATSDASRVRAVISSYRASDLRAAARADAAIIGLPPGLPQLPPITSDERAYDLSIFEDRRTPLDRLIVPTSHYADYPYQPTWSDVFSPTTVARDVIWRVTSYLANLGLLDRPIDPIEEFVRPFAGDWAGLLRCAEVFTHLGDALPQESACVTDAQQLVSTIWTGNVAGMCTDSLSAFASSLTDGFPPLAALTATYQTVAKGVVANANLMETVVTNLFDLAGGLLVDEVGGEMDVWGASSQVRDLVRTIRAGVDIVNNVLDLVSAWQSGAESATNKFGVLHMVDHLPSILPAPPILLPTR